MNKHPLLYFVLFGILAGLLSCVDDFRPGLGENENALVIDGMINDLPGPYTVRLQLSSDPYRPESNEVTGASVSIIEENGEEELLSEIEPGVYQTVEGGIQGTVGEQYKLRIQTQEGKTYESPFQKLKASIPIESVVSEIESLNFEDPEEDVLGYQFYLNTTATDNEEDYYVWLQKGTYKYISPFPLAFIYDNDVLTSVADPFKYKVCYGTHLINQVVTFNTKNLDGNSLQNIPLSFLRSDTRFLVDRYSLAVQQLILSKEAYTYWNNIEKQVESLGSLYAAQPFKIKGNITNVDDQDEEVLGYFTVAGTSEIRVFVDLIPGVTPPEPICFLDPFSYRHVWRNPETWPANVYAETGGGLFVFSNGCIDCRKLGGVVEQPDFWE